MKMVFRKIDNINLVELGNVEIEILNNFYPNLKPLNDGLFDAEEVANIILQHNLSDFYGDVYKGIKENHINNIYLNFDKLLSLLEKYDNYPLKNDFLTWNFSLLGGKYSSERWFDIFSIEKYPKNSTILINPYFSFEINKKMFKMMNIGINERIDCNFILIINVKKLEFIIECLKYEKNLIYCFPLNDEIDEKIFYRYYHNISNLKKLKFFIWNNSVSSKLTRYERSMFIIDAIGMKKNGKNVFKSAKEIPHKFFPKRNLGKFFKEYSKDDVTLERRTNYQSSEDGLG